jgi:hypothetical protein
MLYKTMNPDAFSTLKKYGMEISSLESTFRNMPNGLKMGAFNLISVLFGLFSVKLVNIPL